MKKIKPIPKCSICNKKLDLGEQAFNETLCDRCQAGKNFEAYKILAPIVSKMKILKSILILLLCCGVCSCSHYYGGRKNRNVYYSARFDASGNVYWKIDTVGQKIK